MADEHRMVFDLRGRRKRVVQVVYAVLALLMALSLLTVVGPFSIGDVFGGGGDGDTADISLERADDIERKLARDPDNEGLLLSLVKERVAAGNNLVSFDEATGEPLPTEESASQYAAAADAWERYLRTTSDPSPAVATQMSNTYFTLAQTSTDSAEAVANLEDAARAAGIVAEARPNLGTLSTFAIYSYFAGDFERGDRIAKRAVGAAPKGQRQTTERQLASYRKQGKAIEKQVQAVAAQGSPEQAEQQLENPLGGLSGGGLGAPPAP